MPYYVFAWIASFAAGLYVIVMKLTSKYSISNPWLFNFLWSVAISLLSLVPAVANHSLFPKLWLPVILAGIFNALFQFLFILSIKLLDISTLSPLFNFRSVFAVMLGVLFLGESFSTLQWIIAGGIFLTGILATIDERFNFRSFFKPAIAVGILTMLVLAIGNALTKQALASNDVWSTNLWGSLIKVIMATPTVFLFIKDIPKVKISQFGYIGLLAVFSTISNITSSIGYGTNVGVTSLIMAVPFSMMIVFILSFIWPKLLEKHSLKVYALRFTAAIIMILGSIQLTK